MAKSLIKATKAPEAAISAVLENKIQPNRSTMFSFPSSDVALQGELSDCPLSYPKGAWGVTIYSDTRMYHMTVVIFSTQASG